jgi:hypothetical protein
LGLLFRTNKGVQWKRNIELKLRETQRK